MHLEEKPHRLVLYGFIDVAAALVVAVLAVVSRASVESALPVGLLVVAVALLVEVLFELGIVETHLSVLLGFPRELPESPSLLAALQRIATGYAGVAQSGDALFTDRAKKTVDRYVAEIEELNQGEIDERSADQVFALYIRLANAARKSIFAAGFVVPDFWFRQGGKEYAAANIRAVQRKVEVTRVWIVDREDELTEDFQSLISEQIGRGIQTKIATRALPAHLRHHIAIFDDKYVAYLDVVPAGLTMQGGRFYRSEDELQTAEKIRAGILALTEDAATYLSRLHRPRRTTDTDAVPQGTGEHPIAT